MQAAQNENDTLYFKEFILIALSQMPQFTYKDAIIRLLNNNDTILLDDPEIKTFSDITQTLNLMKNKLYTKNFPCYAVYLSKEDDIINRLYTVFENNFA